MARAKKYPSKIAESGVYMFKNINNGKMYIGSAKKLNERFGNHVYLLNNNKHHSTHFQHAWNQKKSYFICGVIEIVSDVDKLKEVEQKYLDSFKSANQKHGYNICPVANNNLGSKHQRGRLEKSIRMSGKGNNFYGKKHTKDALKLISENNSRRILTNEDVLKIKYLYNECGVNQTKIAKNFGVSPSHICKIINNRSRKKQY